MKGASISSSNFYTIVKAMVPWFASGANMAARKKSEKWKMKNEKWKMKNEKWKMKNEKCKMKNEKWKKWKMKNEKWKMKNENGSNTKHLTQRYIKQVYMAL